MVVLKTLLIFLIELYKKSVSKLFHQQFQFKVVILFIVIWGIYKSAQWPKTLPGPKKLFWRLKNHRLDRLRNHSGYMYIHTYRQYSVALGIRKILLWFPYESLVISLFKFNNHIACFVKFKVLLITHTYIRYIITWMLHQIFMYPNKVKLTAG